MEWNKFYKRRYGKSTVTLAMAANGNRGELGWLARGGVGGGRGGNWGTEERRGGARAEREVR